MKYRRGKLENSYVIKLFNELTISTEDDYVPLMKWSDAMIHDCGSFRCEYLYMDKPVCYMANTINMNPKIWSKMGKDAIDCHELCWAEKGETLDKFIENVVNGNDMKKELRREYREKYCLNYPNGKTPCENIVNAILGENEYKGIFTIKPLHQMRRQNKSVAGLIDLVNYVYEKTNHNLTVVEVGTFRGEGAEIMLNTGKVDKIYCIDPWENGYSYMVGGRKVEHNQMSSIEKDFDRRFKDEPRIVKHKGTLDTFIEQNQNLKNIDLIYIDGLHTHDGVKHDIENSKKLKFMFTSGHDYVPSIDFGGVMKAVDEEFGKPDMTFQDTSWIVENKK